MGFELKLLPLIGSDAHHLRPSRTRHKEKCREGVLMSASLVILIAVTFSISLLVMGFPMMTVAFREAGGWRGRRIGRREERGDEAEEENRDCSKIRVKKRRAIGRQRIPKKRKSTNGRAKTNTSSKTLSRNP